jgi:hypothetical protein
MNSLWVALAMVLTCGLVAPAGALAEPPANDAFANREVLEEVLPIKVVASNVEATKEEGEFIPGVAPSGHSVWYEWEATSTGWTTVGACEADIPTIVGVFTGSKVNELTSVISGNPNASEGPDCPYTQRQYTFKAKAGTKYEIAIDGNGFYVELPPPVTEGEFALRIEATPPPPNDDFTNATPLEGEITEEPGGARFYFAHAQGYNWSATTQASEPDEGTSYGGSVWYTWSAPETAKYRFGALCCGTALRSTVYEGNGLNELSPVATGFSEVLVTAGTTLRILIDGPVDPETEEPAMSSFGLNVSAELPPLPPGPSPGSGGGPPPPDAVAPQTALVKSRLQATTRSATFWFSSSEAGGSFICRLDDKPFKPCTSPKSFRRLKPGRHTFRVKALDAAGNVDASPVVAHFRFPSQSRRHGR